MGHLVVGLAELAPLDEDVHGIAPAEGVRCRVAAGALCDLEAPSLLDLHTHSPVSLCVSALMGHHQNQLHPEPFQAHMLGRLSPTSSLSASW